MSSGIPSADDFGRRAETLEPRARRLEESGAAFGPAADATLDLARTFLSTLSEAPVFVERSSAEDSGVDLSWADEGQNPQDALRRLEKSVLLGGLNPTSPRYFGYIPAGAPPVAGLGDLIAAITDRYVGMSTLSPDGVRMETQLVDWMGRMVGFPTGSTGELCSGGSIGTLSAMYVAREKAIMDRQLSRPGHDSRGCTLQEIHRLRVYASAHAHYAVKKAARVLGLADDAVCPIGVDDNHRLRIDLLEESIRADVEAGKKIPWVVVATAGTTSTGAIDPLGEVAAMAERYRLWMHVDAAYGGFFRLCTAVVGGLSGIEAADSIVLDPHKGLFMPYGIGAVLYRNSSHVIAAFDKGSREAYIASGAAASGTDPLDRSLELTRHFRGLRLWLTLCLAGEGSFRAALEEKLWLARYAHSRLHAMRGIQTGPAPDLSIVAFRIARRGASASDDDATNSEVELAMRKKGRIFLTSTKIGWPPGASEQRTVLRLAILGFRTHRRHVDEALQELATAALG